MLADYFSNLTSGRLAPVPFLIRWLILIVLLFAIGIGVAAAIGSVERIFGGDLPAFQNTLIELFGLPFVMVLAGLIAAFAFASLNIIAKRARDAGLPGWSMAILVAMLMAAAPKISNLPAINSLGPLLVLVLALLPTDQFRKSD